MRTGSAVAIRSWSKASKKATTPMKVRTFTCQRRWAAAPAGRPSTPRWADSIRRSFVLLSCLVTAASAARPGGPGEVDVIHRTPPQPETEGRISAINGSLGQLSGTTCDVSLSAQILVEEPGDREPGFPVVAARPEPGCAALGDQRVQRGNAGPGEPGRAVRARCVVPGHCVVRQSTAAAAITLWWTEAEAVRCPPAPKPTTGGRARCSQRLREQCVARWRCAGLGSALALVGCWEAEGACGWCRGTGTLQASCGV